MCCCLAALRACGFAVRRGLGRLRGVRQGGAGYGAAPLLYSDAKLRFAGLSRRAERHGNQSLTARQSRDLLLISGRVDCVNTPAPLCTPPGLPQNGEGTRLELRELPSLAALGQVISLRAA